MSFIGKKIIAGEGRQSFFDKGVVEEIVKS